MVATPPNAPPHRTAQAARRAYLGTPQSRQAFRRTAQARQNLAQRDLLVKTDGGPTQQQLNKTTGGATTALRNSAVAPLDATTFSRVATDGSAGTVLPPPQAKTVPLQQAAQKFTKSISGLQNDLGYFAAAYANGTVNWTVLGRLLARFRMQNAANTLEVQNAITVAMNKVTELSGATAVELTRGDVEIERLMACVSLASSFFEAQTNFDKDRGNFASDIVPSDVYSDGLNLANPAKPQIAPIEDTQRINALHVLAGGDEVDNVNMAKVLADNTDIDKKTIAIGTEIYAFSADEVADLKERRRRDPIDEKSGILDHKPVIQADGTIKMEPITRTILCDSEIAYLRRGDAAGNYRHNFADRYKEMEDKMMGARLTDGHGKAFLFYLEQKRFEDVAAHFDAAAAAHPAEAARYQEGAKAARHRAAEMAERVEVAHTGLVIATAAECKTDDGLARNLQRLTWLNSGIKQLDKQQLEIKARRPGVPVSSKDKLEDQFREHNKQCLLGQAFVLVRAVAPFLGSGGSIHDNDTKQQYIRARGVVEKDTVMTPDEKTQALALLDGKITELNDKKLKKSAQLDSRSKNFETGRAQALYDAFHADYETNKDGINPQKELNAKRAILNFKGICEHQYEACELSRRFHAALNDRSLTDPQRDAKVRGEIAEFPGVSSTIMQRHARQRGAAEMQAIKAEHGQRAARINAEEADPQLRAHKQNELQADTQAKLTAAKSRADREGRFYADPQTWAGRPQTPASRLLAAVGNKLNKINPKPSATAPILGARPDMMRVASASPDGAPAPRPLEALVSKDTPWNAHPDDLPADFTDSKQLDAFLKSSTAGASAAMSTYELRVRNPLSMVPGSQKLLEALSGLPILGGLARATLSSHWNHLQAAQNLQAFGNTMQQATSSLDQVVGSKALQFSQETAGASLGLSGDAVAAAGDQLNDIAPLNQVLLSLDKSLLS